MHCWLCGSVLREGYRVVSCCPNWNCPVRIYVDVPQLEFWEKHYPPWLEKRRADRAARESHPDRYLPADLARYGIKPPVYVRPSREEMRAASIKSFLAMLEQLDRILRGRASSRDGPPF